ncbi:FAD-binding oxidoreductase [Ktedonosporobacter rubrisoli]|uniref:FAD-binding oxidoreductase n=1 Tax=Ktedonosporobacter rubrisoli TaxID=2509675 RepID=A0A4P6JNX6_KTERU|nr:FAD-binding oxidoreductase [Ktedonosporobacter rubrisoli]QBD76883.1 FAD-binding oxidoreductase [Ktedonosporobacter rubrisoli]
MHNNQTNETANSLNEPASYWQQTTTHYPLSTEVPHTVDVLVVGCGLFGATTGYWLARAGRSVALLDRQAVAYGASGRNGGFVVAGMHEEYPEAIRRVGQKAAHAVLSMAYENQALLRQVLAEEEIACDYREPGSLSLALGEEQLTLVQRNVAALQADGFSARWLDRAEAQSLIRTPLGPEILGGKFLPEQALVHSAKLIQGLVGAARRHGASVHKARALRLAQDGDSILVETSAGRIRAGALVLAVNAWTGELIPEVKELIVPVRGQVLAYAPLEQIFTTAIFASITETEEYWQQTLDGSIVLGGCRALAPDREVGIWEAVPTEQVQQALEQIFPRLFPRLSGLKVGQRWAGLMDFTPDRLPIVDHIPGLERAWFVGGLSGHGMPFGILLGQLLAEAVQTGRTPETLWPLQLNRETLRMHKL